MSCHGTSTNARSWALGWGSVSRGSSEITSWYATMSTSIVRGPHRSSRTRSNASSIACPRSRREAGGSVVLISTTALKYAGWEPGATPHGSVS